MGKKSFVEDYDPLKAHLVRDHERAEGAHSRVQDGRSVSSATPVGANRAPHDVVGHDRRPAPVPDAPSQMRQVPQAARLIDAGAAARRVPASEDMHEVSARVKVPRAAFQDLEAVLSQIQLATGSKVHYSIATRALWGLLVQSEARVVEEIRRIGLRRLPCTRDRVEYADYEEKIRQALGRAFRKMPSSMFESDAVDIGGRGASEG